LDVLLPHQLRDRRGVGIGQVVREGGAVDGERVDAVLGELAGQSADPLPEHGPEALPAHESRHLLAGLEADDRGLRELPVQMLRDDEHVAHAQITFASLWRTWTSSGTEPTLRPPVRLGGVSSLTMRAFGATSTPSSATGISFISFFRAFM